MVVVGKHSWGDGELPVGFSASFFFAAGFSLLQLFHCFFLATVLQPDFEIYLQLSKTGHLIVPFEI